MTPARKKRLFLIGMMVLGIAVAIALVLKALNENLNLFYPPAEVVAGKAPTNHPFRLGGLVVNGSVERQQGSLMVAFALTDNQDQVIVNYEGILPDLFREGQGIVAKGMLREDGVFVADEVLAKHDENYMPPEVADTLKTAHNEAVGAGGGTAAP
jgi:cytochrome c-type biogenesis protein CcmE